MNIFTIIRAIERRGGESAHKQNKKRKRRANVIYIVYRFKAAIFSVIYAK